MMKNYVISEIFSMMLIDLFKLNGCIVEMKECGQLVASESNAVAYQLDGDLLIPAIPAIDIPASQEQRLHAALLNSNSKYSGSEVLRNWPREKLLKKGSLFEMHSVLSCLASAVSLGHGQYWGIFTLSAYHYILGVCVSEEGEYQSFIVPAFSDRNKFNSENWGDLSEVFRKYNFTAE